jgi:hypothetical protein
MPNTTDALLGRNRQLSAGVALAGVAFAVVRWGLLAVGVGPRPGMGSAFDIGVGLAVLLVAISAAVVARNDGLLAVWCFDFAVLFSLLYTPLSGYVMEPPDLLVPNPLAPLLLVSLGFAVVAGLMAFLLGVGIRGLLAWCGGTDPGAAGVRSLLVGGAPRRAGTALAAGIAVACLVTLVTVVWDPPVAPLTAPHEDIYTVADKLWMVGMAVLVGGWAGARDGGLVPGLLAAFLPVFVGLFLLFTNGVEPVADPLIAAAWQAILVTVSFTPFGHVVGALSWQRFPGREAPAAE